VIAAAPFRESGGNHQICPARKCELEPHAHSGFFGTSSHGSGMVGCGGGVFWASGFLTAMDSPISPRRYPAAASPPPGTGVVLF
jgi:hypothetical protein